MTMLIEYMNISWDFQFLIFDVHLVHRITVRVTAFQLCHLNVLLRAVKLSLAKPLQGLHYLVSDQNVLAMSIWYIY